MSFYNISVSTVRLKNADTADLVKVSFGEPASNDKIVVAAREAIEPLVAHLGGSVCLVNGPASLPVAFVLAHALCHLYAVVACYDPKLKAYVVASSHGGNCRVGDLLLDSEVN